MTRPYKHQRQIKNKRLLLQIITRKKLYIFNMWIGRGYGRKMKRKSIMKRYLVQTRSEKAVAPHSSTLARGREAWWAAAHGVPRSRTRLSDFTFTFHLHALEKEMATHSSVPAWRIPRMGEPGGLPSMGSHRVGHD